MTMKTTRVAMVAVATALGATTAVAQPLPAVPAAQSTPDVPALLTDVHLVEADPVTGTYGFTRPMVPAVRTTADGRIGLDVRTYNGDATFYLLGPENLGAPLLQSAPGAGDIVLENATISSLRLSAGFGVTKHQTLCDPAGQPYDCAATGGVLGHDCYDFTVVAVVRTAGTVQLVGTDITVEVSQPKTALASIVDIRDGAQVLGPVLLDDAGTDVDTVLEPTITADSRLIVFRTGRQVLDLDGFTEATDVVYATYPEEVGGAPTDLCDVSQWTSLHRVTHAPYDGAMVGRYGIADSPMRDAMGQVVPDGRDLRVTYPWIDHKGNNLFFEAVGATLTYADGGIERERYPSSCVAGVACGVAAAPEATTIPTRGVGFVGRWSQGKMVVLDGAFNNIDYGLLRAETDQRMLELYAPLTYPSGPHDGSIRVGTGRDNGGVAAPELCTTNTAVIDSLENAFAYRTTMRPLTVRDVVWLVNTGKASDEVVFDDYLDRRALIVSSMVGATEWSAADPRLIYHDGFLQTGNTTGSGFTETVWVQNGAGSQGSGVPTHGEALGDVRLEPVALGGIAGKGLWLNGTNAGLRYTLSLSSTPHTLYAGVFIDNRAPVGAVVRRLFTFPDGSHLSLVGQTDVRYETSAGAVAATIALPASLPIGAWSHFAVVSRDSGHEVDLYLDGFLFHRWSDPVATLFTASPGSFTVGTDGVAAGVRGWIDDLVVLTYDPGLEVACNHARGTLIGLDMGSDPSWIASASLYPLAAHAIVSAALPPAMTMPRYACFHDYDDPLAANLGALPTGTVSMRASLLFPEGPLSFGSPRPGSAGNPFCLSCHHVGADSASLGLAALFADPAGTFMEDDPRRQPLQPPPLLFGNIPAGFLDGEPLAPLVASPGGWSVDAVVYP